MTPSSFIAKLSDANVSEAELIRILERDKDLLATLPQLTFSLDINCLKQSSISHDGVVYAASEVDAQISVLGLCILAQCHRLLPMFITEKLVNAPCATFSIIYTSGTLEPLQICETQTALDLLLNSYPRDTTLLATRAINLLQANPSAEFVISDQTWVHVHPLVSSSRKDANKYQIENAQQLRAIHERLTIDFNDVKEYILEQVQRNVPGNVIAEALVCNTTKQLLAVQPILSKEDLEKFQTSPPNSAAFKI